MKHLSTSRLLLIVAAFFLSNFYNQAEAQTHTPKYISTGANSNGFYEYLPAGYNTNSTQTYPLIIYMHGIGELGDGSPGQLPRLLWGGIPMAINNGVFPSSVTVNGQTHSFIVISPQFI